MHFIKIVMVVIASLVAIKGFSQPGKSIPFVRKMAHEEIDKAQ